MKKRIFLVLLLLISIFSLSACKEEKPITEFKMSGHIMDYMYSSEQTNNVKSKMLQAEDILDNDGDYKEFYNLYLDISEYASDLLTYSKIEKIKHSISGKQASLVMYSNISRDYFTLKEWLDRIHNKLYNSKHKDEFYDNYSKEEIEELLLDTKTSDFYKIKKEADALVSKYNNINNVDLLYETPAIYAEVIKKNNELAKTAGYDNYLDYAYKEIYKRDYTPEDALEYCGYVKKYIAPIFFVENEEFEKFYLTTPIEDYNEYVKFFGRKFYENKNLLDSFAKSIGGSYYTNYHSLWDGGYYTFSSDKKSINNAFTTYLDNLNTPYVYFGPEYHDVLTVAHEYGHYYSIVRTKEMPKAYDLAETHSQSNEFLFLSYLDEVEYISDITVELIQRRYILDVLQDIIFDAIITEMEYKLYNIDEFQPRDIDGFCINICDEYGGYVRLVKLCGDPCNFWKYVLVDSPAYYVSYAMSLIPTLSLFQISKSDFDLSVDIYNSLCSNGSNFISTITKLGLANPFNEQELKSLVEYIASF